MRKSSPAFFISPFVWADPFPAVIFSGAEPQIQNCGVERLRVAVVKTREQRFTTDPDHAFVIVDPMQQMALGEISGIPNIGLQNVRRLPKAHQPDHPPTNRTERGIGLSK